MSAAHSAAPTVFVNEKSMPAMGTISRRTAGTPKLCMSAIAAICISSETIPGVSSLATFHELILLLLVHLLELEVPCVRCRSEPASLQDHEEDSTHNRDKVQREVHEVADDSARCKLRERLGRELTQLCDWVTARLDGTLLRDQSGHVARHESAVEGVDERIVNKEVLAEHIENGGALAEHKQDSRNESERTVEDGKDGGLRHVGHDEHERRHAQTKGDGGDQLCSERTP